MAFSGLKENAFVVINHRYITLSMELLIQNYLFLGGGFVVALVIGLILIPRILLISYKKKLFDIPDARKVHTIPVPRLGGLSFFPAVLIAVALGIGAKAMFGPDDGVLQMQDYAEILFILAGLAILYLIGEADDLVGVGYKVKFVVQIIASFLMVLSGTWLHSLWGLFGIYEIPEWIGMPLTVAIVVYITNAINLIDGIDGLASGLCCVALTVLGGMMVMRGEYVHALIAVATLGVIIPFWFYNVFGNERRGHKLFMGDAGSLTLGYTLSYLVLRISFPDYPGSDGSQDMVLALSTLVVPLFDVVRVVLHRLRKHRNPFLPDRNHIHHKLLRTGMRKHKVLLTILAMSVMYIVLNALLLKFMDVTLILIVDILAWVAIHLIINWRIKVWAKDHPEAAKSYVEPAGQDSLQK